MIDETKPVQQYLSDEQILPVLKRSRELFAERRRKYGEIRSDEVVAALERIDESDDYAKIIWRVQQENSHDEKYFDTDYLARGITNLKLFYSLEMIDGKNLHSLSKTLDVFWHAHQNFSFEYMGFCNRVFGPNQYLHHTPTDKRDRAIQEAIQRKSSLPEQSTRDAYAVGTDFHPASRVWSRGAQWGCASDPGDHQASYPRTFSS